MTTPTIAEDKETLNRGRELTAKLYQWLNPAHSASACNKDKIPESMTDEVKNAWSKAVDVMKLVSGTDLDVVAARVQATENEHLRAMLRDPSLDHTHAKALLNTIEGACNCMYPKLSQKGHAVSCRAKPFHDIWLSIRNPD